MHEAIPAASAHALWPDGSGLRYSYNGRTPNRSTWWPLRDSCRETPLLVESATEEFTCNTPCSRGPIGGWTRPDSARM